MNAINIDQLLNAVPDAAIPWVHALASVLCAKAQAPLSERSSEWKRLYRDVVTQINDPSLDREIAARITDCILNGEISNVELVSWIKEAEANVVKWNDGDHKYGRPFVRDTIVSRLKKKYESCGYEWRPANGGIVGAIPIKKRKPCIATGLDGEPFDVEEAYRT